MNKMIPPQKMVFKGQANEYLQIELLADERSGPANWSVKSGLTILWFLEDDNTLTIDNQLVNFQCNQVVFLTEFHQVEFKRIRSARMILFNRDFYCVIDHDSEVSCKGLLFFGGSRLPRLVIPDSEKHIFETVFNMFVLELQTPDGLQLAMLQMMLKRFLILSTRLFKVQNDYQEIDVHQLDIIREYNFLVEQHFKTKHTVAEYAELLFKSPKTLSNVFSKFSDKTPLQYIHERKLLEARRLLKYTDKSIKEVSLELGFEDMQTFGRFFKNHQNMSPTEYREQ